MFPSRILSFKNSIPIATISLVAFGTVYSTVLPAEARLTEYWNTAERAKSQRLMSTAMNYLNTRYSGKASAKKAEKNLDIAITFLKQAIEADESDPQPHYLLGLCMNMKGQYEQALDMERKAYNLDKSENEILLATGLTQYLNGHYEKAITLWEKYLTFVENKGPANALLGFAYMRMGEFEKAASHLQDAKKFSPGSQLAYQGIAILEYLGGDLERAKLAAEHAQTISAYPNLTLLLARIDYLQGNDASALNRMKIFKRQVSKKLPPRSMTALGFSKQHDFHFDPFDNEIFDSPGALLARSINDEKTEKRRKSYTKQGKVEEMLPRARRLTTLNSEDFIALHETGMLQLAAGDYQNAVTTFQDVLKRCPLCRVDLIYLAEALSKTGAIDNARGALEYYLKHFPRQQLAARYQKIATAPSTTPAPAAPTNVSGKPALPGEGPQTDQSKSSPKDSPF